MLRSFRFRFASESKQVQRLMQDFLGISAIIVALGVVTVVCFVRPKLCTVLVASYATRTAAGLFHFYVRPLPDGTADAVRFEHVAWALASGARDLGIPRLTASYYYSEIMSVLYQLTGRSPLMLQTINILVGTLCVLLTWELGKRLWGEREALSAAWVAAFFPAAVLYSALTMREVYVAFCLLAGCIFVSEWVSQGKYRFAVFAEIAFGIGVFFHAGMLAAMSAMGILVLARDSKSLLYGRVISRGYLRGLVLVLAVALGAAALLVLDPRLPKVGSVSGLFSPEQYVDTLTERVHDDAAYPDWMIPRSGWDLVWIVPLRAPYLLFSPLPWDVSSMRHIAGWLDGLLYMGLCLLVALNWESLKRNKAALGVLFIVIAVDVVFGIGTGNFGTALRHRSKFALLLVVLAAPSISALVTRPKARVPISEGERAG